MTPVYWPTNATTEQQINAVLAQALTIGQLAYKHITRIDRDDTNRRWLVSYT
jgi:hypothetical protein